MSGVMGGRESSTAASAGASAEPVAEMSSVTIKRRTQIREAALTLFADRGYYGTSMEDISRAVGMRASSLYNHVDSKQDILADIMVPTMRELLVTFNAATEDGTPPRKLRRAMEAHVRYHGSHPRDVRIGNREVLSLAEPTPSLVRSLRRDYARGWRALIEEGVAARAFHTPSPQLAAYALLEMGIGVASWYNAGGPLSISEIASQYGDMALSQVGAQPDGDRQKTRTRLT
jgi:AcrR family transcriptional regulator